MGTRQIQLRCLIGKLLCIITRGNDSPSNLLLSLFDFPVVLNNLINKDSHLEMKEIYNKMQLIEAKECCCASSFYKSFYKPSERQIHHHR